MDSSSSNPSPGLWKPNNDENLTTVARFQQESDPSYDLNAACTNLTSVIGPEFSSDGELSAIAKNWDGKVENVTDIDVGNFMVNSVVANDTNCLTPLECDWRYNEASREPSSLNWAGEYDFRFRIPRPVKSKDAQFSQDLSKLFINQNRVVEIWFNVFSENYPLPDEGLFIRAVPIYTRSDDMNDPVVVCRQHSINSEGQLKTPNAQHLIHCTEKSSIYLSDPTSRRLNVLTPLPKITAGSTESRLCYKFTDLGSCPGGLNRRDTAVIFTLEHWGQIIGRRVMPIRICTCPKRDMDTEEKAERKNGDNVNSRIGEGKVLMNKRDVNEHYWVLARGKKNFEHLKTIGEVFDNNQHGNSTFDYKEAVEKFNNVNKGSKKRKMKSDVEDQVDQQCN